MRESTFRFLSIHTHWKQGKTLWDTTNISCNLVVSKRSPIYDITNQNYYKILNRDWLSAVRCEHLLDSVRVAAVYFVK